MGKTYTTKINALAILLILYLSTSLVAIAETGGLDGQTRTIDGVTYEFHNYDDHKDMYIQSIENVSGIVKVLSNYNGYILDRSTFHKDIFNNHDQIGEVDLTSLELEGYECPYFSGCTSLKRVAGIKNITHIGEEHFYNCPSLDFENWESWFPTEPIALDGFNLAENYKTEDEHTISYSIEHHAQFTIPGSVESFEGFNGRLFDNLKFEHSDKKLYNSHVSVKKLWIERSDVYFDPSYLEELINEDHEITLKVDLNTCFNEHPGNIRRIKLQKVIGDGSHFRASFDGCPLEEVDLEGCRFSGDVNISYYGDYPVKISLPEECSDLKLFGNFSVKNFNCHVKGELCITKNDALSDVDLSKCIVIPDGSMYYRGIDISNSKSIKHIIFPEEYESKIRFYELPNLEEVYIGPKVSYIDADGYDNGEEYSTDKKYEIIFGGSLEQFMAANETRINPGKNQIDALRYLYSFYILYPEYRQRLHLRMERVSKLWYGHGNTKHSYLKELNLSGDQYIPDLCFAGYEGLTSVRLSGKVNLGLCSFTGCNGLKSVTIDTDTIECGTFAFCENLETINWGRATKHYGPYAFKECGRNVSQAEGVKLIYSGKPSDWSKIDCFRSNYENIFDGSIQLGYRSSIAEDLYNGLNEVWFDGKKIGDDLIFDEYVAEVSPYVFKGFSSIKNVMFADKYPSVFGARCFEGCSHLFGVSKAIDSQSKAARSSTDDSAVTVETGAFSECTALTEIGFIDNITSMGDYAFDGTAWINQCNEGPVYAGNVYLGHKGTIEDNAIIEIRPGTLSSACHYNDSKEKQKVRTVILPESFTQLDSHFFDYMFNVNRICCKSSTPPICESGIRFFDVDKSTCVLEVPEQSLAAYRDSEDWGDFSVIRAIDASSVEEIDCKQVHSEIVGYYDAHGRFSTSPHNGFNIVRYNDGTMRKTFLY